MKCPKCQANNSEGLNFCEECGERLEIVCPSCGHAIAPGKKFCGKCGKALTQSIEIPPVDYAKPQSYTPKFLAEKILTTRSSIEGERKLVTVLFADVANYTAMAERLDPEEVHRIMDGCFKILMDEIHKYEGTINQFTGDGIMALFGAPIAHEDHAQRACYAALAIQKRLEERNLGRAEGPKSGSCQDSPRSQAPAWERDDSKAPALDKTGKLVSGYTSSIEAEDSGQITIGASRSLHLSPVPKRELGNENKELPNFPSLQMRIGLNSGPVIVGSIGDDLRMDYTAVGDTTNLAARVQQNAKPGEVWISQETHNIIRGYFNEELVGEVSLKGKSQPQALYRLLAERPEVRTRFEAGLVRGMTAFVGRHPELEALKAALERVRAGEAQVVDVVGEAGVGKSRLIHEFQKSLASDPSETTFLAGISVQYGRNINFLPVIDVVKRAFNMTEGMSEEEIGHRMAEMVKDQGDLSPMLPFLKNLLSLKVEDSKFKALNPEGRKYGTFEAVKNLLLAMSQEKPLVLFLEDIHWMDKISQEFFTYFSRCLHGHKVLMISAYRPEASPPWAQGAHYQRLGLETLSTGASVTLVRNILGGLNIEPALEQKITEKTGGNPFFVEEIVRDLLDRGDLVKAGDKYVCRRPIDQCDIPNTVQGVIAARMDRLSEDLKQTMQVASVIGKDFAFRILKSIMELGDELRERLTNLVGLEILYEKVLYPELEYIFKHALTQEVAYESLLKQRRREIHGRIARTIEEQYSDKLEQHYELLAHHYEQSGQVEKTIEYLILAGEKADKNYAVQSAFEFFSKVLDLSKTAHASLEQKVEAKVYNQLAKASLGIGKADFAVAGYTKSVELCRQMGMVDLEMKNLSGLAMAMCASSLGDEEVNPFFEQGIRRSREEGRRENEGIILVYQGMRECTLGRSTQGYEMIAKGNRIAVQSKHPAAIFGTRLILAVAERWFGRPTNTIELTEGLIQPLRKTLNFGGLATGLFIRGLGLAEAGKLEEGMSLFREGIEISEKFGGAHFLGRNYNSLGFCYSEIYHPQIAVKLNLKSEEIGRKLMEENPMNPGAPGEVVAMSKVNIMDNLFDQGDIDGAWNLIESFSLASSKHDFDFGRNRWQTRMEALASQILLQRNEVDNAETIIRTKLEFSKREHLKKYEGRFLRLLGEVQMKRRQADNAITNMSEAVIILKDVGNPRQLWQAHDSLASAFDQMRRTSEAREHWGAAASVIQKTANGLSDSELRNGFLNALPIREILDKAGV